MSRLNRNLSLIALTLVLTAGMTSAQTYWFENYENAVDKIEADERQEMEEALELLGTIVAEHPVPQSRLRVPGDRFVDYLPYFQQARIQMMLGQYDEARKSLDVSEAFPAIRDNRQAMTAMREMRGSLDRRAAANP